MAREELIELARYVERLLPARLGAFAAQLRASRGALAGDTATISFDDVLCGSPLGAPKPC